MTFSDRLTNYYLAAYFLKPNFEGQNSGFSWYILSRKKMISLHFSPKDILTIDSNPRFRDFPAQAAANKAAFNIMDTAYTMISFCFFITVIFVYANNKNGLQYDR